MVQRTFVQLEDDIEGGAAQESIEFGLDGATYAIDLNEQNATRLREAIGEYVQHARKVGASHQATASRSRASTRSSQKTSNDFDPHAVRKWAQENGHQVSARGRISQKILEAFRAAGN